MLQFLLETNGSSGHRSEVQNGQPNNKEVDGRFWVQAKIGLSIPLRADQGPRSQSWSTVGTHLKVYEKIGSKEIEKG